MRGRRKYEKMNIINVENITKSYTGRKLFSKASFYVQENEKIGIIGINGTGKSTLLKIVAGDEEPDEGTVTTANHIVINYLPQNPEFDPDETALEHVMSRVVTSQLDEDMRWSIESDAKSLLMKLDITDMTQKTGELSGGQRKRLALATVVLKPCDVLILDEPTNHLDYEMVEWLEDYLRRFRGAIIMITHDRYFLDSVCNRIVEVDKGQTYSYDTNYSGFLELKAAREESERASERKRQSILRKEIEWMQRGARARSTKQKAHIQRYEALRDQKGPQTDERVELSSVSSRMGRTTIELHDISKAYGDIVCVKNFTYIFLKNDRIGFVGKNGCGKSTLMKIIAGFIEPDSGEVEIGQTIKIGYFGQEVDIEPELRVIDYVKEAAEFVRTAREADQKFNDGVSFAVNQIIPILDTLEMAANAPTTDENYKKGVTMTLDKAAKALDTLHVEEIEALGKAFDPNIMNAVQQVPAEEGQESGTVVTVYQKGYKLGDKIVRHATVVVAE